MEDLFTPAVASRIYVYPKIALYECIRQEENSLPSLVGKINVLNHVPVLVQQKVDSFIAVCIFFFLFVKKGMGIYKINFFESGVLLNDGNNRFKFIPLSELAHL